MKRDRPDVSKIVPLMPAQRIEGQFKWQPPQERPGRLPGAKPPRRPETRVPLLFLDVALMGFAGIPNAQTMCLYLVNNSDESLDYVHASGYGMFVTESGDDLRAHPVRRCDFGYHHVTPGEGVNVERYHVVAEADLHLRLRLLVTSRKLGTVEFTLARRGGPRTGEVLWDTGDAGKDVVMRVAGERIDRLDFSH